MCYTNSTQPDQTPHFPAPGHGQHCLHVFYLRNAGHQWVKSFKMATRAQSFKTNDVVSQRFVKFSEVNFSNMPIFFVEKCEKLAFAVQKLLSYFQQKKRVFG